MIVKSNFKQKLFLYLSLENYTNRFQTTLNLLWALTALLVSVIFYRNSKTKNN